jgi:hypothetical protein
MTDQQQSLTINIPGFTFSDLFNPARLADLTRLFYDRVKSADHHLWERFCSYRDSGGNGLSGIQVSEILVKMAPHLSSFVEQMFDVGPECGRMKSAVQRDRIILQFKKEFFARRALKKFSAQEGRNLDRQGLRRKVNALATLFDSYSPFDAELATASIVMELLSQDQATKDSMPAPSRDYILDILGRAGKVPELATLQPSSRGDDNLGLFLNSVISTYEQWLVSEYYAKSDETKDWITFKRNRPFRGTKLVLLPDTGVAMAST